ncbi:TIGR02452 family protein [Piscinibacter sp. HJYY11]|uniref:TIGR02452 family protein n=1 Tax=Piscinibacter sp. HJYY11 TaxID=2801333 RepID=UPI00191E1073|nr:TIGR02452 family protein [Piscinibacter sp. HJYY11]MBL0729078.1 TIGR02452 family protein [Piscinibacter sp. HJYY11]
MNREIRAALGQQTVRILEEGGYRLAGGRTVELRATIDACVAATRFWSPDTLSALEPQVLAQPAGAPARLEVVSETTLEGARRLLATHGGRVAVLNFASARNPGGGFLGGSQAQEESLARSSALYASLTSTTAQPYYAHHRGERSALYSDRMILSPECPVFRCDDGELLDEPYCVDVITAAAPNAGALKAHLSPDIERVPEVLAARASKVLALATHTGCKHLVLGAWGCGVFANDPGMVAQVFATLLADGQAYRGRFTTISFSVRDGAAGQPVLRAFRDALAAG